jgi:hypothetical protein
MINEIQNDQGMVRIYIEFSVREDFGQVLYRSIETAEIIGNSPTPVAWIYRPPAVFLGSAT